MISTPAAIRTWIQASFPLERDGLVLHLETVAQPNLMEKDPGHGRTHSRAAMARAISIVELFPPMS